MQNLTTRNCFAHAGLIVAKARPSSTVMRRNYLIEGFDRPPPRAIFIGCDAEPHQLHAQTRVDCYPIHSGCGTRVKFIKDASGSLPVVGAALTDLLRDHVCVSREPYVAKATAKPLCRVKAAIKRVVDSLTILPVATRC